jgi:hypothetical protein
MDFGRKTATVPAAPARPGHIHKAKAHTANELTIFSRGTGHGAFQIGLGHECFSKRRSQDAKSRRTAKPKG